MKKIINSAALALALMTYTDDFYVEDLCVKVSKYDNSVTITDLSNASKVGKICKEWKICVNYHCNQYYNPAELCEAVTGCADIVNVVNSLRYGNFESYTEFDNICLYVRDRKGVDTFSPFATVNPVKVPKKWTLSHIWKAIYSGQIVAARRDYRYSDDYAYDAATNFGAFEFDGDNLADLAENIIESSYSGWWVSLNRIDENGNYIIDLGLHSFEAWTLVFNPSATCGITNPIKALGLDTPENLLTLVADFTTTDKTDPDPDNDPSGKPDENVTYSDFDTNFRNCNIISVSFGGVSNSAEPAERAKKTNRKKKLTEKEWKKQLEMKAAFEASEKAAKLEKISAQLRNAQIGDTIIDLSTPEIIEHITSIDREDCDDEPEYFVIKTDYNNVYEGFDFFDDCTTGEPATVIFATSSEPEQADPEQLTIEEVTTYSANEANTVEAPAPVPTLIDEEAAKRGKESYSFSDYVPGSATAAYNAQVAKMRAAAEEQKKQVPEEFHGELDKLVNRYAVKLADWTNRKNRCDSSCPSWAIVGPANYNMRKHEKQMNRLDSLFTEYNEKIVALENKIENFAYTVKHRPIMDGDENALEKLREKVAELTGYQERMKQENTEARKAGKDAPHPAWELSNNRQNLKRYEDRLKSLEKAKADPTCEVESVSGDGFKIVRNSDIMRLQFLFDSKPDEETRNVLKKNGFKWAPSQKAWQRQLNRNGEFAAKRVLAEING